jgi:hypothetical protein
MPEHYSAVFVCSDVGKLPCKRIKMEEVEGGVKAKRQKTEEEEKEKLVVDFGDNTVNPEEVTDTAAVL